MSDTFRVHSVFETSPTPAAAERVVADCRDAGLLYAGRDIDPGEQDDAAIADALLVNEPLADRLSVGHGDVGRTLRVHPTGLSPHENDNVEGARERPNATLSVTDGQFYSMREEADGEAAVVERTEAFLALVAHLYEAFADAGCRPTHAYAPHVRRLADGSVLLAAYETPTMYSRGQHTTTPVLEHLGLDGGD